MTKEKASIDSTATSVNQSETSAKIVVRPPHIALLLVAIVLAVCWWLFLGGMAITTANPVTFNQRQILESERLVVATVSEMSDDGILKLQVTEELLQWKQETTTIKVLHNKLPLTKGESYIFPLSRQLDLGYIITKTELPDNPPLVYTANEETVSKLKEKLKEWRETHKKENSKRSVIQ